MANPLYKKGSVIKSVSLSLLDSEFIDLYNLSPSGLLKQRIDQIREYHEKIGEQLIKKLQQANAILQKRLLEATEEIQCLKEEKKK